MRFASLVLLGMLAPCAMSAQGAAPYVVNGEVIDELSLAAIPLVRVVITAGADTLGAATGDSSGHFSIPVARAGTAQLHLQRLGYQRDSVRVIVSALGEPVNVALSRSKMPTLPQRVVTAQRSAFETRARRGGSGTYFRRADIVRMDPQETTDIIRRVGGLTVVGSGGGAQVLGTLGVQMVARPATTPDAPVGTEPARDMSAARAAPAGCVMRTVVDGRLMHPEYSVNEIPVADIEAIEVYRGAGLVPVEFATTQIGACGVIVIWQKTAAPRP